MYVKSIFLLITIMTFVALNIIKPVKSVSPFVFYAFHFACKNIYHCDSLSQILFIFLSRSFVCV